MRIPLGKIKKHDKITQVSLELIAERGFHGVPMSMIANKAGVGAGTIYRYFKSKDLLIKELHRNLEEKIRSVLYEGYDLEKPLKERFQYLIRQLLRYFIKNPLHFRYMEQYFNSPYGISLRRDRLLGKSGNHDILINIFKQGKKQKMLKELPDAVLFSVALGPLISLIRDHTIGLVKLDEQLINKVTDACWDGIKK